MLEKNQADATKSVYVGSMYTRATEAGIRNMQIIQSW